MQDKLRASLVVAILVALLGGLAPALVASAAENRGLCSPQSPRAQFANNLVVDACFDGKTLYLRNNIDIVMRVTGSGGAGQPRQLPTGAPSAASGIVMALHPGEATVLPPGYDMRIPVSAASADIDIKGITLYQRQYVFAKFASIWYPGGKLLSIAQPLGQLASELATVTTDRRDCASRARGFWSRAACEATYSRNVAFAFGRFAYSVAEKVPGLGIPLSALRNFLDTAAWVNAAVGDLGNFVKGTRSIHINAQSGGATGTSSGGGGSDSGGGGITPPPANPVGDVVGGLSETVGGAANTWTNYSNAGGYAGPKIAAFTTVQITCKIPGFRVADGNTWWYKIGSSPWSNNYYVSADAFYNNGRTSGSLSGTPYVDPAVSAC